MRRGVNREMGLLAIGSEPTSSIGMRAMLWRPMREIPIVVSKAKASCIGIGDGTRRETRVLELTGNLFSTSSVPRRLPVSVCGAELSSLPQSPLREDLYRQPCCRSSGFENLSKLKASMTCRCHGNISQYIHLQWVKTQRVTEMKALLKAVVSESIICESDVP